MVRSWGEIIMVARRTVPQQPSCRLVHLMDSIGLPCGNRFIVLAAQWARHLFESNLPVYPTGRPCGQRTVQESHICADRNRIPKFTPQRSHQERAHSHSPTRETSRPPSPFLKLKTLAAASGSAPLKSYKCTPCSRASSSSFHVRE